MSKTDSKTTQRIEELNSSVDALKSRLEEEVNKNRLLNDLLESSIQQNKALIDAIPDLMFRMNSKGVYLDYKASRNKLYYQAESLIGKNNRDITPPYFADLVEQKISETLRTEKEQVFEYELNINGNPEASVFEAHMVPNLPDEVVVIVRDITSRKRNERNILESETNARAIIDASSDILLLLDREGIVIDCNQSLASHFGLKPRELSGRSIFGFLPETEIADRKLFLKSIFNSGKPVTGETEILCRSYNFTVNPVTDETGNIQKVAVYAYDSTEQNAARKALVENEAIFSSFIENSPIYVFFKDLQLRPVRLSRNYETMLGLPLYKILGKTMSELFPSDFAEKMAADDLSVLKESKPIRIEEEFSNRYYTTIKFPVFIDDKPKYLAGYSLDVTEQKMAEQALRESEERFRKLYAEGTLPIAMLDGDFKFMNANQVFQDTFGYDESELKEMTFKEITHPDHLKNDMENLGLLIERKIDVYRTEKRYLTKAKEIVWGNVQVSIVRNSGDKFMYFLVIIDNITSYKLAEAEIRNKNEQLEKLNAEKDKFFSIIAHDLRSPFNTFLGFTEMMAEELYTMTLDEIQKIATDMQKSANNLYRLLENLLEWSMIERGITPFDPKPILLANVLTENLMTIAEAIRKKSIEIVIDIPDSLSLTADRNMIGTVIRNLLSNAVKFTPNGGRVAVKAMEMGKSSVELIFEDSGIGMDEKMKKSLFNLCSQNSRPGTDGELSTGLGLLLCKEFIEKHGGTIRVESEPHKGSRFIISLKR
ncbi:MAG: PAS domain S-box protein [Bacteroidota bacterium]